MEDFDNLKLHLEDGVLVVTINRPKKLNALNVATLSEISQVMQEAIDDPATKGIIITGEGEKAFVAGADIEEIAELNEVNGRKFSENGHEIFGLLENSHKPVIAAVNGFALGGGCELAMACHVRIASENAQFGLPEVNLGILPGYGGTQRLTELVGRGRALEMMMTGDMISSERALQFGLVNKIVPLEELMESTKKMINKILAKAPLAIGMVINSVNAYYSQEENGYQTEANSFATCCRSQDFIEGTSAFLEKRKPNFTGE